MDFPDLMPKELAPYLGALTEDELFSALISEPADLVAFFETASDDETWTENHEQLMKRLLEWLTLQTFNDRLSQKNYMRAASAVRKHYVFLKPLIPKNILIKLKDEEIPFNGLLLTSSSDFFKQILQTAHSTNNPVLAFPQISGKEFLPFEEFICTREIADLPTKGENELMELIRQADAWELSLLTNKCEHMLVKYLTVENVFERLGMAKKERWSYFQQSCLVYINLQPWGFKLSSPTIDRLAFEFLDFNEPTLAFFENLRSHITDIICRGKLVEQSQFGAVLKGFPDLMALDISGTHAFSNQFEEIPKGLRILNLSGCPWINKDSIKKILNLCPDLIQLFLRDNSHLNYLFWGDLIKFRKLKALDLSNCPQLQDTDISLILRGLSGLTEVSMNNCKNITEKGFFELAKSLSRLVHLNISRTSISDTALVEIASRCRYLTALDVSGCNLSEKGILSAVKQALALLELNIAHCPISPSAIEFIKKTYPQLLLDGL